MEITTTVSEQSRLGWVLLLAKQNDQRDNADLPAQTMEEYLALFLEQTGVQEYVRNSRANIAVISEKMKKLEPEKIAEIQAIIDRK